MLNFCKRHRFSLFAVIIAISATGCAEDDRTNEIEQSYATVLDAPSPSIAFDPDAPAQSNLQASEFQGDREREVQIAALARLEASGITAVPQGRGIRIANPQENFRTSKLVNKIRRSGEVSLSFGPSFDRPPLSEAITHKVRIFPQDPHRANVEDSAAYAGKVVIRDGCLFAAIEDDGETLAIFPADIGLIEDQDGFLAFRYRYHRIDRSLPRVGSPARIRLESEIEAPAELAKRCGNKAASTITGLSIPPDD